MRRAALALILSLGGVASCGPREPSTIGVPSAPEVDAGSDAAPEPDASIAAGAEAPAPAPTPEPPRPDPRAVAALLDRTAQPIAIEHAPYGLRFEVVEQGPALPWAYGVVNRGTERVRVAFDPRLLILTLEPPPPPEDPKRKYKKVQKPKPIECKLPEGIRPAAVDKRVTLELEPGEGMVEVFDPRLYCLPTDGKSPLVPGTKIVARLGFPVKSKTVWRKGKRVVEVPPQVAPFVAEPVAPPSEGAKEPSEAKPAPSEKASTVATAGADPGVKELVGSEFTLGGEYAPPPPPEPAEPPPLELLLARGSDARSEETATVTVQLRNRSKSRQHVFFRRELVSFEVSGPDGTTTCDPQPDGRAPDRQAFRTLAPGTSITATSRLIELCPDDTFARPGLYLAYARFEASETGEDYELEAVTGLFTTEKPAVIRIRTGELPILGQRVMQPVKVGE